MKFDMGQAWSDAMALISNNRDLVVILAGVFLFLPSLALGVLAPTTELQAAGNAASPEQLQALMLGYLSENWLIILLYGLLSTIGTLAMLALLGRGQRPTVGEAIGIGAKALIPYLLASILLGLIVGLIAAIVGAGSALAGTLVTVLLFPIAIIAILFVVFRLLLIAPIMAIEDILNPITAMSRSWNLIKGNTRYIALFVILLVVALLVLSLVIGLVASVVVALLPAGSIALWANALIEAFIGAIITTVSLAIYAAIHRQFTGGALENIGDTFD